MSERSAALGIKGPPKTIEHNGKVYSVAPVVTEGTMLAFEQKLYERAKTALLGSRDLYTPDEFTQRADALRKQREDGHFAFEGAYAQELLAGTRGALVLLSCMISATEAEAMALITERTDEITEILNEALADSFPKGTQDPKPKAPGPNLARRNRGGR